MAQLQAHAHPGFKATVAIPFQVGRAGPRSQRQLKEMVAFANVAKISSASAPARSRRNTSRACSSGLDLSTSITSPRASFRRVSSSHVLFSESISHWGSLYSQWSNPPGRVCAAQLLQGRCPSHYRQVGIHQPLGLREGPVSLLTLVLRFLQASHAIATDRLLEVSCVRVALSGDSDGKGLLFGLGRRARNW